MSDLQGNGTTLWLCLTCIIFPNTKIFTTSIKTHICQLTIASCKNDINDYITQWKSASATLVNTNNWTPSRFISTILIYPSLLFQQSDNRPWTVLLSSKWAQSHMLHPLCQGHQNPAHPGASPAMGCTCSRWPQSTGTSFYPHCPSTDNGMINWHLTTHPSSATKTDLNILKTPWWINDLPNNPNATQQYDN